MYPDGGRKLARTGMRNKLFSLHGLIDEYYFLLSNANAIFAIILSVKPPIPKFRSFTIQNTYMD